MGRGRQQEGQRKVDKSRNEEDEKGDGDVEQRNGCSENGRWDDPAREFV